MQSLKESAVPQSARCFDNDITAIIKSKIASASKLNYFQEGQPFEQDSKTSKFYLDSILKIIQPYDEKTGSDSHLFKMTPRIREFPSTFQRVEKQPIRDWEEAALLKRDEMDEPTQTDVFEKFNGEFESDSETVHRDLSYQNVEKVDLRFLALENLDNHFSPNKTLLDFKTFIKKANNRFESNKIYECEICKQKFDKHAALGGHMSKIHPKTSKKFEERMNVYALRKGEREKRHFLNNL